LIASIVEGAVVIPASCFANPEIPISTDFKPALSKREKKRSAH
jgi:hypothetical protein